MATERSTKKRPPPPETNLSRPLLRSVRFTQDEFDKINEAIEARRKITSIFISFNSFVVAAALEASAKAIADAGENSPKL